MTDIRLRVDFGLLLLLVRVAHDEGRESSAGFHRYFQDLNTLEQFAARARCGAQTPEGRDVTSPT